MTDVDKIMERLDKWVSLRANGKYLPAFSKKSSDRVSIIREDTIDTGVLHEDHGIQQVRDEIEEFVKVILNHGKLDSILEIGLGHCGSTHFLWRQFFNKVITVEKSYERIREFSRNVRSYYNEWVFDDGKSYFLIGYSNEPSVVKASRKVSPEGIDVLFIDGDHKYEAVLTDWLLYSPLVKKGGIIAFHDSMFEFSSGAPQLLKELSEGTHDGKKHLIYQIVKSDICGIGYYINE